MPLFHSEMNVYLSDFCASIVLISPRNWFLSEKKDKVYFYPISNDRFCGEKSLQNTEKFPFFLAVSQRNRKFTFCLFLPEARNLDFFLYGDI